MIYSMPLLSINVLIVGLFDASSAVQVRATPQMWTPINGSILKQITFSPLSRQLWEKNNSSPSLAYSFDIPSREHCEGYCLNSCQTTSGEGKSGETFVLDFFVYLSQYDYIQTSSLFNVSYYYKCQNLLNNTNEIVTCEKYSLCDVFM